MHMPYFLNLYCQRSLSRTKCMKKQTLSLNTAWHYNLKKSRKAFKAVTDLVLTLQWPNQSKPWTPSNQERRPPSNTAYKLAHLPPPQLLLLRKNCTRDRPSPSYACHMAVQTACPLRNKQSTFPVQPLLTTEGKETPVPFHNLLQLSAITSHHYLLWGTQFSLRRLKKKNTQQKKTTMNSKSCYHQVLWSARKHYWNSPRECLWPSWQ